MASWRDLLGLNPYEFLSARVSEMGSKPSRCNACIPRSGIAGIPNGLSFPFLLGICIRRNGRDLYPFRFSESAAFIFWFGVLHMTLSTPGVFLPLLCVTRLTAKHLA